MLVTILRGQFSSLENATEAMIIMICVVGDFVRVSIFMVIRVVFFNGGLALAFHIYLSVDGELNYARSGCRLYIQCLSTDVVYSRSYFADAFCCESTLGSIWFHSLCPFRHAMFMSSVHDGHSDASAHIKFAYTYHFYASCA